MLERITADAIDAWAFTRRNLVAEVTNLPTGGFDHRPHPDARSVAELCHHVLVSGRMFVGEIARAEGSFARRPMPHIYAEYAADEPEREDRDVIVERLGATWSEMRRTLGGLTPEFLLSDMIALSGEPVARVRMLYFASSHEFYHTGQLTVYARTLGIVPALTRQFQAMVSRETS